MPLFWKTWHPFSLTIPEPDPERYQSPVLIKEAPQGAVAEIDGSRTVIQKPVTALLL